MHFYFASEIFTNVVKDVLVKSKRYCGRNYRTYRDAQLVRVLGKCDNFAL
ncbi:MAG: hypothetical protein ACYSYL_18930 [Planctomycetota bacterium]